MKRSKDKIPDEVLKEIFPKKVKRSLGSDRIYSQLKQIILSGKSRKGKRLFRERIAQDFNVNETIAARAFSRMKKDGLVIIKGSVESFVA